MGNTFFIGDTHFGHEKIIQYENRPFQTIEEMDRYMIEQWNRVVSTEDDIFHVGDFSFYPFEKSKSILSQLNGKKHFIIGNHDTEDISVYYDMGFQRVYDYPIIFQGFWLLSHEPLYINSNMPYANIFGHIHANPEYTDFSTQSYCVCVERIHYQPISFNRIKQEMGVK